MNPRKPGSQPLASDPISDLQSALSGRVARILDHEDQCRAAVAIILRNRERVGLEILLIRRAHRAGDPWSGQIGFPGGRASTQDESPLNTAIRETKEEIGLALLPRGRLLGQLDDIPAFARGKRVPLNITPFIFASPSPVDLRLNREEVEAVLWARVVTLRSPEARGEHEIQEGAGRTRFPAFRLGPDTVWGLTYRMLCELFCHLDDSSRSDP